MLPVSSTEVSVGQRQVELAGFRGGQKQKQSEVQSQSEGNCEQSELGRPRDRWDRKISSWEFLKRGSGWENFGLSAWKHSKLALRSGYRR